MSAASAAWADVHTGGVPALNSNPGADFTVYLNFSGFNFTGTWGGGPDDSMPGSLASFEKAPAAGSFDAASQARIKSIFVYAAEKYVGMNVNFTTVDPAVAAGQSGSDAARQAYYDSQARMAHTVISGSTPDENPFVAGRSGTSKFGGIANAVPPAGINGGAGRGNHTNWVFADSAGTGAGAGAITGVSYIAAHEVAHLYYLDHQAAYVGTTQTRAYATNSFSPLVAPIMGNASGSVRGTWREGPTSEFDAYQRDVSALMDNPGMVDFNDDGVGHTRATATPLALSGNDLVAGANGGWITPMKANGFRPDGEDKYTRDLFSFDTLGGALSVTINESNDLLTPGVADGGGTLDSILRLLDGSGNVLASVTDPAAQVSTLVASLAAGTYYLEVASAGGKYGTPSAVSTEPAYYYDMGSYFLSGSVAVPEPGTLAAVVAAGGLLGIRRRRAS